MGSSSRDNANGWFWSALCMGVVATLGGAIMPVAAEARLPVSLAKTVTESVAHEARAKAAGHDLVVDFADHCERISGREVSCRANVHGYVGDVSGSSVFYDCYWATEVLSLNMLATSLRVITIPEPVCTNDDGPLPNPPLTGSVAVTTLQIDVAKALASRAAEHKAKRIRRKHDIGGLGSVDHCARRAPDRVKCRIEIEGLQGFDGETREFVFYRCRQRELVRLRRPVPLVSVITLRDLDRLKCAESERI